MRIVRSVPRRAVGATLIIGLLVATGSWLAAREQKATAIKRLCEEDNGGITLPPGFCATVFADDVGHARHLVVAPNGVVYINTWSGRYYGNDTPPAGGFLVALQDTKGDGRADVKVRFGESIQTGSAGGTRYRALPRRSVRRGRRSHRAVCIALPGDRADRVAEGDRVGTASHR
jgi:hypothetical protein